MEQVLPSVGTPPLPGCDINPLLACGSGFRGDRRYTRDQILNLARFCKIENPHKMSMDSLCSTIAQKVAGAQGVVAQTYKDLDALRKELAFANPQNLPDLRKQFKKVTGKSIDAVLKAAEAAAGVWTAPTADVFIPPAAYENLGAGAAAALQQWRDANRLSLRRSNLEKLSDADVKAIEDLAKEAQQTYPNVPVSRFGFTIKDVLEKTKTTRANKAARLALLTQFTAQKRLRAPLSADMTRPDDYKTVFTPKVFQAYKDAAQLAALMNY